MHHNDSNNPVYKHAQMRAYIQHRQRVMDIEPRIDTKRSKSVCHSRFNSFQKREENRRIQKENGRLLEKLIKISERKAELAQSRSSTSSTRRSSSYSGGSRKSFSSNSSISNSTVTSSQ
ncbi:unnamed protein product [Bursaphelenchus xylophilus]|uniref:(pine wood nematode) hypothetical protein n=1 Tax=Bursaphelenchus xylophilus TaxID=6326 RepID=A0A1I7SDQ9_BURXY|nr:unnamed protein product [Bursaphelenchus xylophilus]CAG9084411.1 unnamed protein product [Bursaphelenchus xylophilus]